VRPVEFPQQNTIFAKDQPEYLPLPAHVVKEPEGRVITCWELTSEECAEIFVTGRIWISQMTFGGQLQPQLPSVASPFEETAPRASVQMAPDQAQAFAEILKKAETASAAAGFGIGVPLSYAIETLTRERAQLTEELERARAAKRKREKDLLELVAYYRNGVSAEECMQKLVDAMKALAGTRT
jgi:hypothetical protein